MRGVYFVRPSDDELMAVWLWDSEADWDAAFPRFGPSLQEYVVPSLAQPPDRAGGDVVNERALVNLFKAVIANNRAGGWRNVRALPQRRTMR